MRRNKAVHEEMGEKHCLYSLVLSCLHDRPDGRPTVERMNTMLKELYEKHLREVSVCVCVCL